MSLQRKMEEMLAKTGVPHKRIHCYGSQIMITTMGMDSANEWVGILHNFATTVRKPYRGVDDTEQPNGPYVKNRMHEVWRVWATI